VLQVLCNPKVYATSTPNCCIVVADTAVVVFDPGFQTVLIHLYFGNTALSCTVNIHCPQYCIQNKQNLNLQLLSCVIQTP